MSSAPLALALALFPHDPLVELPPQFELLDVPGALAAPTDIEVTSAGTWLVAEKLGRVRAFQPGPNPLFPELQGQPVLDLSDEVNLNGDRGLLAIAVHPGFAPDGGHSSWLYLSYTASPVFGQDMTFDQDQQYSHGMLTRYRVVEEPDGTWLADLASRQVLLGERLPDGTAPDAIGSVHSSHANGSLVFAPDGTLIAAAGDGAHWDFADFGGQDPPAFDDFVHPTTGLRGQLTREQDSGAFRSRDLRSLCGKLLRIDPDTGLGLASNPWFDGDPTSLRSRVFATGFRNPFRVAHRPGTGSSDPADGAPGQLIVADVGYGSWEELDLVDAGGFDYGWPCFEGNGAPPVFNQFVRPEPNPFGWPDCGDAAPGPVRGPLFAYHHTFAELLDPPGVHFGADGAPLAGFAGGCVIGGVFYAGGGYPSEYDGRYFFADFAGGWLRTATLAPDGELLEVRDFATGLNRPTAMALDPASGDVILADLGNGGTSGHLMRLRFGQNLSPTAALAADVTDGPAPLEVEFDASASIDPEFGELTYRFDFGDGTPPLETDDPTQRHVYSEPGLATARVEVEDPAGLSDEATLAITVGLELPTVWIASPTTGLEVADGTLVELIGGGSDADDGPVDLTWRVDLYHDSHVHPEFFTASTQNAYQTEASYTVDAHGTPDDLDYYRIELTASADNGTERSVAVWVYPEGQTSDPVGAALPIARVFELWGGGPQGAGNPDLEVIRDGVQPGPDGTTLEQFDSFHFGEQGEDDWFGYELVGAPHADARFIALEFQEGRHFPGGGWFESLAVEVEIGAQWIEVEDLVVEPPYPADPVNTPDFERYTLHFEPIWGTGIRLRGEPGGSSKFASCAELRARMLDPLALEIGPEDLSQLGAIISRLDELDPPYPLGDGNQDPETIRNATTPQPGSTSLWAQVDTFHAGEQQDLDYVGYRFDPPRTIERVVFQEGPPQADGGWFETLELEVREAPEGPWLPVPEAVVTPLYRSFGPHSQSYESFAFDLPPRVVEAVRVSGVPGGSGKFVSIAELSVFGPQWDPGLCGFETYGELPAHTLELASVTPPVLGLPGELWIEQAQPGALASVTIGTAPAAIPIGQALWLVEPSAAVTYLVAIDADGEGVFAYVLPDAPELVGAKLYSQAASIDPSGFDSLRLSNGLAVVFCAAR